MYILNRDIKHLNVWLEDFMYRLGNVSIAETYSELMFGNVAIAIETFQKGCQIYFNLVYIANDLGDAQFFFHQNITQ